MHTSHIIAKYVVGTSMLTKLGIYAIYANFIQTYMEDVYAYMYNIQSLQSTMWQLALYTYLTYITE